MRRLFRLAAPALALAPAGCPSSPPPTASSASASALATVAAPSPTAFAEVSAGGDFTCARLFDGTARCWGWNRAGQLGDGTLEDRAVPTPVVGLGDVTQIAAGEGHACALRKDGAVFCWGDDRGHAVGKPGEDVRVPFQVPIAADVSRLALGWGTTCVTHPTDVGCWGEYVDEGNSTSKEIRLAMPAPPSALFAGGPRACAIVSGQALCWGENESVALAPGRRPRLYAAAPAFPHVLSLGMSTDHLCAVGEDHHVRCLGSNRSGQLGDGTTDKPAAPVEVKGIGDATAVIALDVATCALLQDGTVSCWGGNTVGQLGDGSAAAESLAPVPVAGLRDVVAITGKSTHACALTRDHRLYCWGSNRVGALGQRSLRGSAVPVDVAGIAGATAIAAGGSHTCARLGDGTVSCFGASLSEEARAPAPAPIEGLAGVEDLAVEAGAFCARTRPGRIWCAGASVGGQLPEGPQGAWPRPQLLDSVRDVAQIALGPTHGCARFTSGAVSCWGKNDWGQTGGRELRWDEGPAPPARVAGLDDARALALGRTESCALDARGKVRCWGAPTQSWDGIVDDPTQGYPIHAAPVTLALPRATAIAHGLRHGCALLEDGTVWCWGRNDYGQLGDGHVSAPRERPAPVSGLAGVVEIALGSFFGCARTRGGEIWCWGDNFEGQLGDGTRTDRTLPVAVAQGGGALALALGHTHACALMAGGLVRCWGSNLHRELGQGAPQEARAPLEVIP